MGLKILGTAGTAKGLEIAKREGAHQVFESWQRAEHERPREAAGGYDGGGTGNRTRSETQTLFCRSELARSDDFVARYRC